MLRSKDLLRKALLGNAALSGLSGLVLIIASGAVAGLLGPDIPASLVVAVGVVCLGFAIAVAAIARPHEPEPLAAVVVTTLDVLWILGSVALLAGFSDRLSTAGFWLVLGQAVIVADFALLQAISLRRQLKDQALPTASTA